MRFLAITVVFALGFAVASAQSDEKMAALEHLLADPEVKSDKVLRTAFNDLKQLALMANPESCDSVAGNFIGSLIGSKIPDSYQKKFVFQQLVSHFMLEHAKACNDVYPIELAQRKAKLDESTLKNVETLAAKTIPENLHGDCGLAKPIVDKYIVYWVSFYDYLLEVAKDDTHYSALTKKLEGSIDFDGLKYLFNVYVHDTCKAVRDQMGDLLQITKYDLNASGIGHLDEQCAGYADDTFVMTVCNKVVSDEEYRESALEKLVVDADEKGYLQRLVH